MLIFITSVKHPKNSKSYDKVWRLLNNTLNSVCNQKDINFKVIVVCNKKLILRRNSERILKFTEFIEVDFPPVSQIGFDGIRIDRGTKYCIGLVACKKYNPDYIMFFDADDYVGNNISEYVNLNLKQNGWINSNGYLFLNGKVKEITNPSSFCGTGNILRYELVSSEIPPNLTIHSSQSEIMTSIDEYYLKFVIGSHTTTREYYEKKSICIKDFPYRSVMQQLDTGEQHSDFNNTTRKIKMRMIKNPHGWHKITEEQKKYFNIQDKNIEIDIYLHMLKVQRLISKTLSKGVKNIIKKIHFTE